MFNPKTDVYTLSNDNSHKKVEATIIPFSPHQDLRGAKDIPNACWTPPLMTHLQAEDTFCMIQDSISDDF